MIEVIEYRNGYKYQLAKEASFNLAIEVGGMMRRCGPFLKLYSSGRVSIDEGYAWDGCSGPTKDDETNQRGGLYHDAGYQLIRNGLLDAEQFRPIMDEVLHQTCLEDGMNRFRAWYYFKAVKKFGGSSAEKPREVKYAPYKLNPEFEGV